MAETGGAYQYSRFNYKLIILGVVVVVILTGLIYDMVRTHFLEERLHRQLNQIASEAALTYLPDEPVLAKQYVAQEMREKLIPIYPESIKINAENEPYGVEISTIGQAYAYMAFPLLLVIGRRGKLNFEATGSAAITVEDRGPVWRLPEDEVFLVVRDFKDFELKRQTVLLPHKPRDGGLDRLQYWPAPDGEETLKVGQVISLNTPDSSTVYAEAARRMESSEHIAGVAVVKPGPEGKEGEIVGFASFMILDASQVQGTIGGYFTKDVRKGGMDRAAFENECKDCELKDFGLIHRGDIRPR